MRFSDFVGDLVSLSEGWSYRALAQVIGAVQVCALGSERFVMNIIYVLRVFHAITVLFSFSSLVTSEIMLQELRSHSSENEPHTTTLRHS